MKTLVIDPGHGGSDPGGSGFGYLEKDLSLVISKRVRELLKEYSPDITRTSDISLSSTQRTNLIKNKYKYCLSIHLNAFNGTARGIETIHAIGSKEGKEFAIGIANSLHNSINIPIRRVFEREGSNGNYYYMHRNTGKTTTVIVECLFLDNAEDVKALNVEKISQAIANGFKEFMEDEEPMKSDNILVYNRTLFQGVKGEDVRNLQQRLTDLGFAPNGIDGSFGPGTKAAVDHFQSYMQLDVDGRVGPATIKALNNFKKKDNKLIKRTIRKYSSNIFVMEIPKGYVVDVDLGVRGRLETVSKIVDDKLKEGKKILAGINLGFFNFNGTSEHLGMLIDEGLYYSPPSKSFIDFIYYKDGTSEIINLDGYDANLLVGLQRNANWAIGTSYSLIQKGKINLENSNRFAHSKNREPRSMLGIKKDGTFILAVADGRKTSSLGLTATQQANIMLGLGCYNSVNLDGGGSSTMIAVENGKAELVNKPNGGQRKVGSVLLVYESK